MDFVYEKIAGKGPARKYNLEKCRKELEKSCSDYQNRGNRFTPTPRSTPCIKSATTHQQPPSGKQEKKACFQTGQSLNETAHAPQRVKRCPFQYNEKELRQRAHHIRTYSLQASRLRIDQPPVPGSDPFDRNTGYDFSNDYHNDSSNTKDFTPRRHPTLHRQNLTQDEFIAIRDAAARIASHCAVPDKRPYPDPPAQETLHRMRSSIWLERAQNEAEKSAEPSVPEEKQDDNGISFTEDGCIIQRGFDISPMTASPVNNIPSRCDSGFGTSSKTPQHNSPAPKAREEPLRPNVRNRRGARVPVCFRKQDIVHQRKISHLSALFSDRDSPTGQPKQQRDVQKDVHHAHTTQQRRRMPVPARPLVFFSGSSSSDAVVFDSDDDNDSDDEEEEGGVEYDSATRSAGYADGAKDLTSAGYGSVVTPINENKPAETVKTSSRLPQRSAPPSPPSSKLPVPSPPRVEKVQPLHAGTPLPQRLSKHPNFPSEHQGQASGRPPRPQQGTPRPQFLRSQQTARVFLAHQQRRRAQQPLPPRPKSPCQELALPLPPPPNYYTDSDSESESHNNVSALLERIERNGGRRPANFSWDHVAPMHGFSPCSAFYVLD
ncbi:hypothetical protein E4T52_13302 [Aureobasidium sp. EXF-3400]|nr:hypothetical protein E4T51_12347 [Aureobasidium sp. EXF-12344]KAI4771695.1 hypothetical protein E4T52_13302 [Aureobasidium sp. EXF-3400]